jgi:hypothetical protein
VHLLWGNFVLCEYCLQTAAGVFLGAYPLILFSLTITFIRPGSERLTSWKNLHSNTRHLPVVELCIVLECSCFEWQWRGYFGRGSGSIKQFVLGSACLTVDKAKLSLDLTFLLILLLEMFLPCW